MQSLATNQSWLTREAEWFLNLSQPLILLGCSENVAAAAVAAIVGIEVAIVSVILSFDVCWLPRARPEHQEKDESSDDHPLKQHFGTDR